MLCKGITFSLEVPTNCDYQIAHCYHDLCRQCDVELFM